MQGSARREGTADARPAEGPPKARRLDRPQYLRVLVVLVAALVAAGSAYAAALRPLPELLANTGGLLVGVWGVRALLLGPLPPYSTAVDVVLTLVIFLLLGALTVRALYHLHARAGLRVLPGARAPRGSGRPAAPPPKQP